MNLHDRFLYERESRNEINRRTFKYEPQKTWIEFHWKIMHNLLSDNH